MDIRELFKINQSELSEAFIRFIENTESFIFIVADHNGKIVYSNRPFSSQISEDIENVIGNNFFDYLIGFDENCNMDLLKDLIEENNPFKRYLHVAGAKNIPRTYHCHIFRIEDYIFISGEPEVLTLEHTGRTLMEINNDLANLHRNKNNSAEI